LITNPKISICIPTYNRLYFLSKAVESCLNQSFQDFEIVISDNSDDDESMEYIAQLKESRIRYFKNENNLGFTGNFNMVITKARGKYIKVLMDDDLMDQAALSDMVKVLDDFPTVGVVMSPMNVINQKGEKDYYRAYLIKKVHCLYRYQKFSGLIPRARILLDFLTKKYPCCVPSALLYRRECFETLGGLDLSMKFATDVEICMRIAKKYDFYYIDKLLTSWRCSSTSITVNLHKTGNDAEEFYYLTEKFLYDSDVFENMSGLQWEKIRQEAYMFATKRCFLSVLAGIQKRNIRLIINTFKLIFKKDPYVKKNLAKVVLDLFLEFLVGIGSWVIPPKFNQPRSRIH
jgi:GT2 family glycosyltransferase